MTSATPSIRLAEPAPGPPAASPTALAFRRVIRAVAVAVILPGLVRSAELDAPPPGAFTIVVIPDTQGYFGRGTKATPTSTDPLTNPVFANHTRWIVENRARQNIVFVTHVGDIVDINNREQWQLARACLDRLHGVVPYGLTVGNHDMKNTGDSSLFQEFFGAERFARFAWYGGCFRPERPAPTISGNNANSYQLFSAADLEFVHLNLECNAPDDVLAWAGGVLTKHADRRALLTTHMDLGPLDKPKDNDGFVNDPKGRMRWVKIHGARGNSPVQMWEKLYRHHANLAFIFSGDQSRTTALTLAANGSVGNLVRSLLSDYTSTGPLRVYRFLPSQDKVQVITYDTTRRELVETARYIKDRHAHQFTLDYLIKPVGVSSR
ncbi:MAG: metallophosphoesterase [Verrucomicrobia bacterium]|nr:metallophosphoesterase [Verrucomicrobiota bacterium]